MMPRPEAQAPPGPRQRPRGLRALSRLSAVPVRPLPSLAPAAPDRSRKERDRFREQRGAAARPSAAVGDVAGRRCLRARSPILAGTGATRLQAGGPVQPPSRPAPSALHDAVADRPRRVLRGREHPTVTRDDVGAGALQRLPGERAHGGDVVVLLVSVVRPAYLRIPPCGKCSAVQETSGASPGPRPRNHCYWSRETCRQPRMPAGRPRGPAPLV